MTHMGICTPDGLCAYCSPMVPGHSNDLGVLDDVDFFDRWLNDGMLS